MSTFQIVLLCSLMLVAALHVISRLMGAVAGALWAVAGFAYGMTLLCTGGKLVFLGIDTTRWIFAAFMVALFVYHAGSAARILRLRISAFRAKRRQAT